MGRDKNELRKFERRVKSRKGSGGPADWAEVNAQELLETIGIVAARGGALRFGYTRDGGAYAIGVYGDGQPYTIYVKPSERVEDYLEDIRDGFSDLPLSSAGA